MQLRFIAQPQEQLGMLLQASLSAPQKPVRVTIVSAFASLQAVLRLRHRLHELHSDGALVRIVVGVDMGGTSKEVLQELATWPVEVFVFKNRKSGVTFHPKLYIVETAEQAEIFLGSNNLTDGGLYGNYEGAVCVTYDLSAHQEAYDRAKLQLKKFIEPGAPVARQLDAPYLEILLSRSEIPSDAEVRQRRKAARGQGQKDNPQEEAFGFESTPGPSMLPLDVQGVVIAAVRHQLDALETEKRKKQAERRAAEKIAKAATGNQPLAVLPTIVPVADMRNLVPLAQIAPQYFYLELTATQGTGATIPGEQRIPLEAISSAQEFWGWPENYIESINPRKGADAGGEDRVYLNWKPMWRIYPADEPTKAVEKAIRMYYYVNSSDFRFYSSELAKWATAGDIVRITLLGDDKVMYDCALAYKGTDLHEAWKARCNASSEHSQRVFGFS